MTEGLKKRLVRCFEFAADAFWKDLNDPTYKVEDLPVTTEVRLYPQGEQTRTILMTVRFEYLDK